MRLSHASGEKSTVAARGAIDGVRVDHCGIGAANESVASIAIVLVAGPGRAHYAD